MRRLAALLAALWLGMQIGFGYIAAPILFARLEKITAGNIAGSLFHAVNWLGLAAWLLIWFIWRADNRRRYRPGRSHWWAGVLLGLTAFNEFLMTPVIEALKTGGTHWLHNLLGGGFGIWHGMSSMVYLAASLLGFVLCILLLRLVEPPR